MNFLQYEKSVCSKQRCFIGFQIQLEMSILVEKISNKKSPYG